MSFWKTLFSGFRPDERRLLARGWAPILELEIEGVRALSRDWSAGGAAIIGIEGDLAVGDILAGTLGWEGSAGRVPFTADIVRIAPDGTISLRWLELDRSMLRELDERAEN